MAEQTTQLLERIADALEQLAGSNDSQGWQQPKSVQAVFLNSRASGAIGYPNASPCTTRANGQWQ